MTDMFWLITGSSSQKTSFGERPGYTLRGPGLP
jgi:hypothetical protein